jgi:membrane protease YdiL (CAAX protease family)
MKRFNTPASLSNIFLILSPIFVLLLTRLGVELSIRLFPPHLSWIPAFIGYYLAIALMLVVAIRFFSLPLQELVAVSFKPLPRPKLLLLSIIVPALLPLGAFLTQLKFVPPIFLLYIFLFACINPVFEEAFWRGLLFYLPGGNAFRMLYSAVLFSFSHFFFWGYWYKLPIIIIPTVLSTGIMGIVWMWFMQKKKNLLYPVLSHAVVDILNLSVAVYYGLISPDHF